MFHGTMHDFTGLDLVMDTKGNEHLSPTMAHSHLCNVEVILTMKVEEFIILQKTVLHVSVHKYCAKLREFLSLPVCLACYNSWKTESELPF